MIKMDLNKKKAIYKSKNRGCKEMDIILSRFVNSELDKMTCNEIEDYLIVLDMQDLDIYQNILGNKIIENSEQIYIINKIKKFIYE